MNVESSADTYNQMSAGSKMQGMVPETLSRPWLALTVRLSVFPVSPFVAPNDLWEQAVGEPPETDQNQPRQHQRVQTGPWRGGSLQVTISPHRVVWFAAPIVSEEGLPNVDNWPVIGILPQFIEVTRPWLIKSAPEINRIGFGLHSLLPAADRISAYRLLQELVPSVKIEPEATSDFFYQINRPVTSRELPVEIRLNRLMKWSVPLFGPPQIHITAGEVEISAPASGRQYVSLENDVNTPAEYRGPLAQEKFGAIYDELVELAWKNLEFGEKA